MGNLKTINKRIYNDTIKYTNDKYLKFNVIYVYKFIKNRKKYYKFYKFIKYKYKIILLIKKIIYKFLKCLNKIFFNTI